MRESGAKVLAIESDKTIVLDRDAVVRAADELGISIVALHSEEMQLKVPA
jgi:DUF1009 family protein